jgi:glycosyltransferase involved in cell wall biosynthesis
VLASDIDQSPRVPTSRRRILYIVSAFPRFDGDIITPWLGETILRLRDVDVDVSVLAPAYHGGADQTIDGIAVHRFRYAPASLEMLSHDHPIPWQIKQNCARLALIPGYLLSCTVAATRLAMSGQFDVVHAFWPLPHAFPAMIARRITGVPLVSTFFGSELHWLAAGHVTGRLAARAIVRESDAVTAISEFTAGELRAVAPAARPEIIPFGGATDISGARSLPPFSGDAARFLFVGRLVARKGVDVLIRALHTLPAPAQLVVIGDGAERQRLEMLVRELGCGERVTFKGQVPRDELERAYAECDALVLPALPDRVAGTEGLGVVLVEALQLGLPVIASNTGGIPDIVRHDVTGLLVPPGEVSALAAAMRRFMDDPPLAHRLAAQGTRHVRETFGWSRIVRNLRDLYDGVCARRSA